MSAGYPDARTTPDTVSRLGTRGARSAAVAIAFVGIVAALAVYSTHSDKYAILAAVVVLCVGLAVFEPTILPGAAIVGALVLERIAGASTNLSISDALLFVGTLSALIVFRSTEDRDLRALLGLVAIYEAMMVVPVLDNPYRADFIEWGHELFLAGGALICGWVVGRKGHARLGLGVFLFGACVISLWAAALSPLHHFHPAYLPGGYQKNAIGDLVAFATLAAYANPTYLALSPRIRRFVIVVTLLGIAASQSRQAEIGLIVGILFVLHRRGGLRKQGKLIAVMVVPVLVYIGLKVQHQTVSTNQFNSVHQRLSWYHDSLAIFHVSPWIGVGLRWWYTNRFSFSFQPPNGELEMLTSGGLIGLCGFLILNLGALRRLRRIDWEFGTLAFAAVLMRFTQGQFDIFWVAGSAAIPWLLSGVALGARTRARQQTVDDSRLPARVRPREVELLELSSTRSST